MFRMYVSLEPELHECVNKATLLSNRPIEFEVSELSILPCLDERFRNSQFLVIAANLLCEPRAWPQSIILLMSFVPLLFPSFAAFELQPRYANQIQCYGYSIRESNR